MGFNSGFKGLTLGSACNCYKLTNVKDSAKQHFGVHYAVICSTWLWIICSYVSVVPNFGYGHYQGKRFSKVHTSRCPAKYFKFSVLIRIPVKSTNAHSYPAIFIHLMKIFAD